MVTAKVLNKGNDQIIQFPEGFHLNEKEYNINVVGNAVILVPIKDRWESFENALDMFSDDVFQDR